MLPLSDEMFGSTNGVVTLHQTQILNLEVKVVSSFKLTLDSYIIDVRGIIFKVTDREKNLIVCIDYEIRKFINVGCFVE